MAETAQSLLGRVLGVAREVIRPERVADARRRQADMFAWRASDYVPMAFAAPVPALKGLPDFDWAQQFADPAVSLYMQLKNIVLPQAASGSDYVPAVRADTGVINGPSILGAPYDVPPHTKPVITRHVPADALAGFQIPEDVSSLGAMPTMIRHARHHRQVLEQAGLYRQIGLHHCDLQGPFDIAAQARGHDEIFLDLYTNGDFVHALMEKCAALYVKLGALCKQLAGDALQSGHANEFWMETGSVRLCDDSGILVSARQYEEFLSPYLAGAIAPFGGGWIHYCGGIPDGNRPEGLHLHELYCSTPLMRGLQFTTGKDLAAEIRKLNARKVVYLGGYPRGKDEPLKDYFRRVLSLCPGRRGMIFSPDIRPGEHSSGMEIWQEVQDEMV